MSLGLAFWLLYILCFVFSFWAGGYYATGTYRPFGPYLAVFILIFLLGWRLFGFVIQN
jgi:hypothetical protein